MSTKVRCRQNIGVKKIYASTKYRRRQNIGVCRNYVQVQRSIFFLSWPSKVRSDWLQLAGQLFAFTIFDRTPWAEILTAKVWQKSVKSWQAPTFCRHQYFVSFCHGGPVQPGWDSAGESPPIKAGRQVVASHLATAWGGDNIFKRRVPARSGRSQPLWTLPGQNSKKMLRWTCTKFLHAPVFCRRLYFVDAYLLSTHIFFRLLYFVDA